MAGKTFPAYAHPQFYVSGKRPIDHATIPFSCRGRCFKTNKRSPVLECMCDHACMFLGDCCYDYLLKCDPRDLDISVALDEQYSVFRQLDRHSSCVILHLSKMNPLKMVNSCPSAVHNSSAIASMCKGSRGKQTMSTCVSVLSDGVFTFPWVGR